MEAEPRRPPRSPNPRNVWLFWLGQIISSLGSSVTAFALPLLVFKLTGSAFNLALATTLTLLPYLCFGRLGE
jgi:hypothetical protein